MYSPNLTNPFCYILVGRSTHSNSFSHSLAERAALVEISIFTTFSLLKRQETGGHITVLLFPLDWTIEGLLSYLYSIQGAISHLLVLLTTAAVWGVGGNQWEKLSSVILFDLISVLKSSLFGMHIDFKRQYWQTSPTCLSIICASELPVPTENRKTQLPPVSDHTVPDELLVSLTSTFCRRSTAGHTAHHRHCKVASLSHTDIYLEIVCVCLFENCSRSVFVLLFFCWIFVH